MIKTYVAIATNITTMATFSSRLSHTLVVFFHALNIAGISRRSHSRSTWMGSAVKCPWRECPKKVPPCHPVRPGWLPRLTKRIRDIKRARRAKVHLTEKSTHGRGMKPVISPVVDRTRTLKIIPRGSKVQVDQKRIINWGVSRTALKVETSMLSTVQKPVKPHVRCLRMETRVFCQQEPSVRQRTQHPSIKSQEEKWIEWNRPFSPSSSLSSSSVQQSEWHIGSSPTRPPKGEFSTGSNYQDNQ